MPIYAEYDGIKGDVTDDNYTGQIAIDAFNFAVSRSVSMSAGNAANREQSSPQLSEIQLTKELCSASPHLFNASVAAAQGKKCKLHFVRTADGTTAEYMTYELEDCVVSGYSISADGGEGGVPLENISLSYSKLTVSHTQYDKSNKVGTPVRSGYDLALAKAI